MMRAFQLRSVQQRPVRSIHGFEFWGWRALRSQIVASFLLVSAGLFGAGFALRA